MKRIATYRDFVGELTVTYKRTDELTIKVQSSRDAADYLRKHFEQCMDNHEEFKILHLNNSNSVVNVHHVSKGGLTGTLVDVRLAVREALHIVCAGVIICHNHPSGTTKPSQADRAITQKLKTAFNYFDINVLDHIILTRETYLSMADEGLL
tara:strand:+ start:729 stop:1184 length:456 start_codon:yes stop_codon:yes gene_type:complete